MVNTNRPWVWLLKQGMYLFFHLLTTLLTWELLTLDIVFIMQDDALLANQIAFDLVEYENQTFLRSAFSQFIFSFGDLFLHLPIF
jgi:hypothetical protein